MSSTPDSTIIDKVRKLLALADEAGGGTDGERAAAMAAATRLMTRHRIDEARLRATDPGADTGIVTKDVGEMGEDELWKLRLLTAVGQVFTVDAVFIRDPGDRVHVVTLIGRPDSVAWVHLLFDWLVPQVARDAAVVEKAEREYRAFRTSTAPRVRTYGEQSLRDIMEAIVSGRPIGTVAFEATPEVDDVDAHMRRYLDGFYTGAIARIAYRLDEAQKAAARAAGPGTDLVRFDRAAIDRYYGDDAPTQEDIQPDVDPEGLRTGDNAGGRYDLDPSNKVDEHAGGGPTGYLGA